MRVVNNFVKKIVRDKERLKSTLHQINTSFTNGFSSLNKASMSPAEVKKIELKKSAFLSKIDFLIKAISECSSISIEGMTLHDKMLETTCIIYTLPHHEIKETKYFNDYEFALNIIRELVEETKFPQKDEYLKLNLLYKKYKELKRKKANEKL